MAISPLSGAGPEGISGTGSPQKVGEDFGKVMKAQHAPTGRVENAAIPVKNAPMTQAKSVRQAQPGKCKVEGSTHAAPSKQVTAAKVIDQVNQAQNRMEQI